MAKGKYEYWRTEEGLLLLAAWARDGLTDEQIAKKMGICRDTLVQWKKKYPDISDTLKKGKEIIDVQVENSLLKKALGYSYKEATKESKFNAETNEYELIVTKEITKTVPPDTTAQIFWLKNRRPDIWRDKKDFEVEGSLDTSSTLTDEELENEISKIKSKLGLNDE